jgi:hypothetical protein
LIKKVLLLLFVAAACSADQVAVSNFKYVNTNENSTIIDPNEAQDLLNVDITPGGKSVKKRAGYGLYKTVVSTSTGNHGGFHGYDSTGNDIQIWASSTSVMSVVADATPVQLVSSMTINSTIDCANTQGSMYCVNSSRTFYIRTDGATITSWSPTPLGTMIEATPDRVVVAGVAATPSTIYVSGANAFTTYTVGPLSTDPFTEVIAAPGSRITHLRWGCQKLLWWKEESFGYLDFEDQYTAQVKIISDNIGTVDNTSAVDPGGSVWFRGQDGHIYEYNCSGLIKQSIEITPQMQTSGRRTANSYTQTTQADFDSGTITPTGYLYTSSAGDVQLSTSIVLISSPSFEAGPNNSAPNVNGWTVTRNVGYIAPVVLTSSATSCNGGALAPYAGTYYLFGTAATNVEVHLLDSIGNITQSVVIPDATNCTWTEGYMIRSASATATNVKIRINMQNGIGNTTIDSNAFTWPGGVRFWYVTDSSIPSGYNIAFDNFVTFASTGLYISPVVNKPNLATWNTFNATTVNDGTSHSFYIRASTSPFTITNATPTWTAQTAGAGITITTGTYFQVRDEMAITFSTQVPKLLDFTVNWYEGTASDQAYMLYFDNAIWASMSYGVGISSNNYIFRRDLINQGWGLYNFGAGGMLVQGNRLYFGSVVDGKVFQFGSGTSDNGNAITSYWKSKDFTAGDPFVQSSLMQIDVFAKQNTGQSITSTYTMDTSTSTAYSVSLNSALNSYVQSRKLLPSGKTGYTFNLKLGDSSSTSNWEVFGFRMGYTTIPWKPTQ